MSTSYIPTLLLISIQLINNSWLIDFCGALAIFVGQQCSFLHSVVHWMLRFVFSSSAAVPQASTLGHTVTFAPEHVPAPHSVSDMDVTTAPSPCVCVCVCVCVCASSWNSTITFTHIFLHKFSLLGISSSCEGHLDHSTMFPYPLLAGSPPSTQ